MNPQTRFPRWLTFSLLIHLILFGLFGVVAQNSQLVVETGEVSMEVSLVKPEEIYEEPVPVPEQEMAPVLSGENERIISAPEIPATPVERRPPFPLDPVAQPKVEVPRELKMPKTEPKPATTNLPVGSRSVTKAAITRSPLPKYPRAAIRAGVEGVSTLLRVTIGPDGRAQKVSVLRSCGRTDMDESAIRTVQSRWRFKPAERLGKPVASTETITIHWKLE